jgi:TonB-linked SusC/RagA family outer membrane protein
MNSFRKPIGFLLLLFLIPLQVLAQEITVGGVVSDLSGEPIIGASVVQKGTTNGVITDIDGKFSLRVPANATLQISFVGFRAQEIVVGGKTQFNVRMHEDAELLDEVVVVGYGQMKRSDLTGAVVSVNEQAIQRSVPTSIDQVLQGRAAGVQIQANSGTPGATTSIRIRGINSLNISSQPIFVIDGVVIDSASSDESNNPLSGINPSDIASMDILKDASATAIYGARASNGVVMITTKRGKVGKGNITYEGYVGWQEMPKSLDMMNLREYAQHHNDRAEAGIVVQSNAFIRPELLSEGTNWQKELFRQALMTGHNISATGGSEAITYSIGAGYLTQEGIALASAFKRLSLRGTIDAKINDYLKAGLTFSLADTKQVVGTDNGSIMNALMQQPSVAVKNADGGFDGPDDIWMPVNPIAFVLMRENHNKKQNYRFTGFLEAQILKSLSFKTELSTDYNKNQFYYYQPDYKFGVITNDTRTARWTKTETKYWSWRNILTYNQTFAKVHNLNVMLGQEMSESHWENQVTTATGFLTNTAHDPSAGDISKSTGTGTQNNSSLFSFFGRVFYSYDDRYLLTGTLRRDGSSRFARAPEDRRWGWFPSAALAWKMSNESFLKDNPVINNLKLRLGWGATGNQNVENFAYMARLRSVSTPWGSGVLTGNTPNPDLKWETTYSSNIGLDINLFGNRVEFIADVYYKKTTDLLLQIPLPSYLGSAGPGAASNPWNNVGSLRNQGIELTLNTVNIDSKSGFSWRTNLVFSLNRSKVLSMDTASSSIEKPFSVGDDNNVVTRTAVGQPIGQFWGYKVIGRFNKAEDFYYKDNTGAVRPVALPEGSGIELSKTWIGDYIFADLNGDGVINNSDCTFIGNPAPKFTYGIGNTFSYKGLDLTIFLTGSYGNDVMNYNRRWIESPRENTNLLRTVLDYAHIERIDPNGTDDYRNLHVVSGDPHMPRISASRTNANNRVSDLYIEDGSYLRIQNISIGYTLPKKWIAKAGLQNVKVYANLQNVYTFTKYSGYDPEIGSMYGDALMNGLDYGRYPSPRIYTFGMNVTF